jgi:hypothetical protein
MHWNHQDESCTAHYLRKNEIRARKETAIALINPDEYRIAEVEYDGQAGCMADELEVTMSVLNDYREYILSATGSLASRWGRNG